MSAQNSDNSEDEPKDDCEEEEESGGGEEEDDDGRRRRRDNEEEEEEGGDGDGGEETNNNNDNDGTVDDEDRDFDLIEAEAVLNVQNLGMTTEEEEGRHRTTMTSATTMERSSRDPPVFSSSYSHGNLHVYKCSECNYETYNLAALTSHQKTHKMYQCDVCQMKFSHSANMRRHRMRHTGYKPFECQVCHKRFFRKDHMTEHMVTHSKQLQLHCPLCDKTFHRQVYFKAHLQAEHWNVPGEKVCRICGHKAATMKGAKLHYTTRHAANPIITMDYDTKNNNDTSPDSSHNNMMTSSLSGLGVGTTGGISGMAASSVISAAAAAAAIGNLPPFVPSSSDYGPGGSSDESRMISILDGSSRNGFHTTTNLRSLLAPRRSLLSSGSLQRVSGRQSRSNGRSDPSVTIKVEMPDETTTTDENGGGSGEFLLDQIRNSMPSQSYDTMTTTTVDAKSGEHHHHNHNHHHHQRQQIPSSLPSLTNHSHSNTCSPNSTLDVIRVTNSPSSGGVTSGGAATATSAAAASVAAFASVSSVLNRQLNLGDLSITPVGGILVCVHCGIVFPDQTLYFLHKGVHSENNPWKCNICGELCRDKYDFNTHILSKAHQ